MAGNESKYVVLQLIELEFSHSAPNVVSGALTVRLRLLAPCTWARQASRNIIATNTGDPAGGRERVASIEQRRRGWLRCAKTALRRNRSAPGDAATCRHLSSALRKTCVNTGALSFCASVIAVQHNNNRSEIAVC